MAFSSWQQGGDVMEKNGADKNTNEIEKAVLNAFEIALDAQLKAIRRLKSSGPEKERKRKSMSQVDMVYDILRRAGKSLHISEILDRVEKSFGQRLDRESVVSSLVKKVQRQDRFVRTDKNVFSLKEGL
jgi:hypothetical protein